MQPKIQRKMGLFLALASALTAVGCPPGAPPQPEEPAAPAEPVRLRVACPGEPAATIVARYGPTWAHAAGASVEVVGMDQADTADAWVLTPAEMPRWAQAGRLLPAPPQYTAEDGAYGWSALLPLLRNKLLVWDRTAYGLPLLGDAPLCVYRSDWLGSPRYRAEFKQQYGRELAPPGTWQDFAEIAEFFQRQKPDGSAHSLPPLPADDDALDRLFYSVAVPFARPALREAEQRPPPDEEVFSFHYDLNTGRPRNATAGFVAALKMLQRLQACRPPHSAADPLQTFAQGGAALCLADAGAVGRFQQAPQVRGKFGLCRVPGSRMYYSYDTGEEKSPHGGNHVPYLGAAGWLAVVPRTAPRPDAAFALFAGLSDRDTSRQIATEPAWGGGAYRRDHFDNPRAWYGFGLDHTQTLALLDVVRQTLTYPGLKNPVVRLRTPDQGAHRDALVAELRPALEKGAHPAAALAAVARRWDEIDRGADAQTRLNHYRLSLGLQPVR
jgi:ABC-type glycerol-3-phosphate transport system substrate-binding protein